MKICFISSMHRYNDKRVVEKEAIFLEKAGHKVIHICPGFKNEINQRPKIRTILFKPPKGIRDRIFQLFRLYKIALSINADVYHCNEVDSWIVGVWIKLFKGKICVFDVHEHYPSTFSEKHFPEWMAPIISHIVRIVFFLLTPFTNNIVLAKKTVSGDFPGPKEKLVLVRNFATLDALKFATAEDEEKFYGNPIIIHLGLFSKHRGWPQVLEAVAMMKNTDAELKIIGEINDGTTNEFKRKVEELGLSQRVKMFEWLPFEEAFIHLTKGHIGLVTFQPGILNHVYAMPHKMFDYMAAGMAVLCPKFAVEIAPIVEKTGSGLLIDPSSPKDIAYKLDKLIEDRKRLSQIGKNGQRAIKTKYSWEAEAKKLINMYKNIENNL